MNSASTPRTSSGRKRMKGSRQEALRPHVATQVVSVLPLITQPRKLLRTRRRHARSRTARLLCWRVPWKGAVLGPPRALHCSQEGTRGLSMLFVQSLKAASRPRVPKQQRASVADQKRQPCGSRDSWECPCSFLFLLPDGVPPRPRPPAQPRRQPAPREAR